MAKLVHYIDAFFAMLATLRLRLTCDCLLFCFVIVCPVRSVRCLSWVSVLCLFCLTYLC